MRKVFITLLNFLRPKKVIGYVATDGKIYLWWTYGNGYATSKLPDFFRTKEMVEDLIKRSGNSSFKVKEVFYE